MLYEAAVMPTRTGQTWTHSVHWGQIIYKNIKIDHSYSQLSFHRDHDALCLPAHPRSTPAPPPKKTIA